MKVWVTRDKKDGFSSTCIWDGEPFCSNDKIFNDCVSHVNLVVAQDRIEFKKYFGFTPRKGSCKQYELTLKEIKE